jgi:hypothetical protein
LNPGPGGTPDLIESVLSIYHGNIRSLRNKINYITNLIEEFDIVFFTETHLNNQITDDDIAISGFDVPFRKDRNSHGGGINTVFKTDPISFTIKQSNSSSVSSNVITHYQMKNSNQ